MSSTTRSSKTAAALLCVLALALPAAGSARETATAPRLRVFAPQGSMKAIRYGGGPVWLDAGVLITSQEGPFEIRVRRPSYTSPIEAEQVIRDGSAVEARPLPADLVDGFAGLNDFLTIDIARPDGKQVSSTTVDWCPNGYDRQRTSDEGPSIPTYPSGCPYNPFTRGMLMGLDRDWAVNVFESALTPLRLKDGTYVLTVTIAEPHRRFFGIAPEDAEASLDLVVKTRRPHCRRCHAGHRAATELARTESVPTMNDPDPAILPDLLSLPSWGINVDRSRGQTVLSFGATVWVGGASSLVVEGFRRPDEPIMDAYQYFYEDGQVIGRAPVGEMEFDKRRGHHHWHFRQFVAYRLLDADSNEVVRSTKEAFCLAPTDALDLLMPGAVIAPETTGFYSSCGSPSSIWIRETLPLGWGDTYYQSLPGQSFDITNLPNGHYYIEVDANPDGNLHEQDLGNNSELREVILRGKGKSRRVEVPPWNGIDTH